MDNKIRVLLSWSSGKDSTLALLRLLEKPEYHVVGLFTTYLNDTVPFQATPLSVVKAQARAIGLPLILQPLSEVFPPNKVYQRLVVNALKGCGLDIDSVAFGDMFCNGIAEYRQSYIEPAGWSCVFPLLGEKSSTLAEEIQSRGIRAFLSTVDSSQLDSKFVGREYDRHLIKSLPDNVDRCGENGEFHTLVYDAPCFREPLSLLKGDINRDNRFHSVDVCLDDARQDS